MTDTVLIERIQAGDMSAFNILLERYKRPVYSFIYHMVSHHQDTEDLFQETFMRVIKGLKNYRHEEKFLSWVTRIANNLVIDTYRKKKNRPSVSLEAPVRGTDSAVELKETIPDNTARPDTTYEDAVLKEDVNRAIEALPFDQRQIFLMRHKLGMPFKDIAELLDISINTALGRMHYAMQGLRKKIIPVHGGYQYEM